MFAPKTPWRGKVLATLPGGCRTPPLRGVGVPCHAATPGRKDRGRGEEAHRSNAPMVRCPCFLQKHHGGGRCWRPCPAVVEHRRYGGVGVPCHAATPGRKDRGRGEEGHRSNAPMVRCLCFLQKHHGGGGCWRPCPSVVEHRRYGGSACHVTPLPRDAKIGDGARRVIVATHQ